MSENSQKHKENHQIPNDILDDLASRFIINVPVEERSDFIRICFQIELAHWFYLDFYCSEEEVKLVPCGIKQFALHIFQHIPFLKDHLQRLNDIMNEFKKYKMSVPTYGAILMTSDRRRVLLVQSYWAKSSWGFPKGKVNEDEEPLHCAVREVYEETGFDTSRLVQADDYIEGVLNYQYTRLYIVPNVPAETVFIPRTRKEIKACEWFQLDYLPCHKTDTVCKTTLGINANSFFMIMPFVKRLKRWLADHPAGVVPVTSNPTNAAYPVAGSTGQIRIAKRNNGPAVNAAVAPAPAQTNAAASKRRQRNKSTGDIDGFKAVEPVAVKVAPAAVSRASNILQVAAAVSSSTTTPMNTSTTSSTSKSRVSSRSKNGTFKRQLFSAGSAAVPTDSSGASSNQSESSRRTSNPLTVVRAVSNRPAQPSQTAAKPATTSAAKPRQANFVSAANSPPPTIMAKFNGAAVVASNGLPNPNAGGTKTRSTGKLKKRRSIESFLHTLHIDPAIQLWKHFTFSSDTISSTLPTIRFQPVAQ